MGLVVREINASISIANTRQLEKQGEIAQWLERLDDIDRTLEKILDKIDE